MSTTPSLLAMFKFTFQIMQVVNKKSLSVDTVTENNATAALAVIVAGLWITLAL
jgi:hypothetical protein